MQSLTHTDPSFVPSFEPSFVPSLEPSLIPTALMTLLPTTSPSAVPIAVPLTGIPTTVLPSPWPSFRPTKRLDQHLANYWISNEHCTRVSLTILRSIRSGVLLSNVTSIWPPNVTSIWPPNVTSIWPPNVTSIWPPIESAVSHTFLIPVRPSVQKPVRVSFCLSHVPPDRDDRADGAAISTTVLGPLTIPIPATNRFSICHTIALAIITPMFATIQQTNDGAFRINEPARSRTLLDPLFESFWKSKSLISYLLWSSLNVTCHTTTPNSQPPLF